MTCVPTTCAHVVRYTNPAVSLQMMQTCTQSNLATLPTRQMGEQSKIAGRERDDGCRGEHTATMEAMNTLQRAQSQACAHQTLVRQAQGSHPFYWCFKT